MSEKKKTTKETEPSQVKEEKVKVKKIVDVLKKQQNQIKKLEEQVSTIQQLNKAVNDLNSIIQQFLFAFNNHIHVASPTIVQSRDIQQQDNVDGVLEELE
jgi:predicted RNase H-like nuclease (RuvC/YqgF family)